MALSRREFIRGGLVAAGTAVATLSGFGFARNLFAQEDRRPPLRTRRLRYVDLERSGELERRERALWDLFSPCRLCPRMCRVNRSAGRTGACSSAQNFKVASSGPHHGEEGPIRGTRGSGTIFFSNCNLLCVFCQNWQIAHRGDGATTSHEQLANIMLDLQRRGCHNINMVTPTHLVPHLVKSLRLAIAGGLTVPLLYNTGGYDSLEVIRLLDGIVDIYMPDFKYQDSEIAERFSQGAPDYVRHTSAAIREMHRQVGVLSMAGNSNVANSGLLIRHLVMPDNMAGTDVFVRWVASTLGRDTHVNIMAQYRPMHRAREFPPLNRALTQAEFSQAMRWARDAGLHNFH